MAVSSVPQCPVWKRGRLGKGKKRGKRLTCRQLHLKLSHQMQSQSRRLGSPDTLLSPLLTWVRGPRGDTCWERKSHQFLSWPILQKESISEDDSWTRRMAVQSLLTDQGLPCLFSGRFLTQTHILCSSIFKRVREDNQPVRGQSNIERTPPLPVPCLAQSGAKT